MANEIIDRGNYAELSGGLSLNSKSFNFDRDGFSTIEEMKNYSTRKLPPMYLSYNLEDRKIYKYDTDNTVDEITGKWREFGVMNDNSTSIDDNNKSTETTYSSNKIENLVNGKINDSSKSTSTTYSSNKIENLVSGISQLKHATIVADSADLNSGWSAPGIGKILSSGDTEVSLTSGILVLVDYNNSYWNKYESQITTYFTNKKVVSVNATVVNYLGGKWETKGIRSVIDITNDAYRNPVTTQMYPQLGVCSKLDIWYFD